MGKFEDLLQETVNKDYDDIVDNGERAANRLYGELLDICEDRDDAFDTMIGIIAACVGTDGTLTQLEYDFFCDVFDVDQSYDSTLDMLNEWNVKDAIKMVFALVDELSYDGRVALASFCLDFMAVDEKISNIEVDFLEILFDKASR